MSNETIATIDQPELQTQKRVIRLFTEELGYRYLGNWKDEHDNRPVVEKLLTDHLTSQGYSPAKIRKALHSLQSTVRDLNENLYTTNKATYKLLRYGINVKEDAASNYETVHLIDWRNPENNDFGIAEEVTIKGQYEKRPDLVLYVNGIALGIIELKRSSADVGDGIRQNIKNQEEEYGRHFFSTMQLLMAGNETQGLSYGTIGTPQKYYLHWKEDVEDNSRNPLDKYLLRLCSKQRILELIYDFVLFDGGEKKLPRFHQYFAVKNAQEHIRKREGGIIWHTQGSGKSLVMVILAKWILENNPNARVAVITDRDELDKQIEGVFRDAGEDIKRSKSGRQLLQQLSQPRPRLLCSLVHKFGSQDEAEMDDYVRDLEYTESPVEGELFVFVDECHRTQSGKLNKSMKKMLPNAVFIGFTGTPLLKKDKPTSLEIFGKYIHTYKFNEAVEDEVVLDLVYEARDINQELLAPEKVDQWFEEKTKGLNDYQKSELKKHWGTLQKVLSSKDRMQKIVNDIVFDFSTKPRLNSGHGNAILVASSIYEACRYYELFQETELKGKCALISSYAPDHRNVVMEATGENTLTEREYIQDIYENHLLTESFSTTEKYEDWAKEKFKDEPVRMKLLIVVDKLLTGFDAPSCTYLYIDKTMRDHGLFQAICRVNRLDGPSKDFGFIVDYMDLFKNLVNEEGTGALQVYTEELDYDEFEKEECDVLIQDRLKKGREQLDEAQEHLHVLCEPVEEPKEEWQYIQYFCGNTEIPEELQKREPQRNALYKGVVSLLRAYANIADQLEEAGYSQQEIEEIRELIDQYTKLREVVRNASGETIDLKPYEADMRHLIDTYIEAEESRKVSALEEMPMLDVIQNQGVQAMVKELPEGIQKNKDAVAETIENNVRQKIIKEHLNDPAYYDEMSKLLDQIIRERKKKASSYEKFLSDIAELAKKVNSGMPDDMPSSLDTPAKRALYNNMGGDEELALKVDKTVRNVKRADFRGDLQKENEIKGAIYRILQDEDEVERVFKFIKEQQEY